MTAKERKAMWTRQKGKCASCGLPLRPRANRLTFKGIVCLSCARGMANG